MATNENQDLDKAIEEVLEEVENEDTEINEFKASHSDHAELPEPVGAQTSTRKGDERNPEKKPHKQGSSDVKTKHAMISDMIKHAGKMNRDDLSSSYKKFMNKEEYEDDDYDDDDYDDEKKKKVDEKKRKMKESYKITTDDVDLSEDAESLFEGTELSEDAQDKITSLIETVVVAKINDIVEELTADAASELSEQIEIQESVLEDRLSDYLDHVVDRWMEVNEVNIETGLRSQIAEDFIHGLKTLFVENYIDIPEEKVDVVEELSVKVSELQEQLNDLTEENIELKKIEKNQSARTVFENVADGLTDMEKEKFENLAEGLAYDDLEDYEQKLDIIKENFFTKKKGEKTVLSEELDMLPLDEDEEEVKVNPSMRPFVDAISRTSRT